MKRRTCLVAGVTVAGLFSLASPSRADDARAAPVERPMNAARAVDSILDARDPSAAVEAYSKARAALGRRSVLSQAYVRRMTDFDLPEMAASQAAEVLEVDLTDPLAKAVVAATRAKAGDAAGAVSAIATAAMFGADEPFVRRTAGRVLAWHDTRSGPMAEDLESSLAAMRKSVGATPEAKEAYRVAFDAYVAERTGAPKPAAAAPTLLADRVEADAEDDGAVVYSAALTCAYTVCDWSSACAPCGWWSRPTCFSWAPSCGVSYVRRSSTWCGPRVALWPTRTYTVWTTPLGNFSSSRWGGWSCAPSYGSSFAPRRGGWSDRSRSWGGRRDGRRSGWYR